ncbi:hypothetical protein [Streptococcus pyogenes]|uniref:hypothetical protein n=1 Tax=Streptococcus pyogenes TaxID=1314 RepID=UPI0004BE2DDB|nr:hypothetical protein [Streptococcus pyogenes]HER4679752.1 hypothetical protein [Streptococcus pyogenes NGAS340]HER4737158.1 hypothetical protein [Streptococcus pyogenes NGAS311]UEN97963.1 hypothetical protein H7786_02760 [Streptococcus pyogenes]VGQ32125.1 prophage minor structural protein [Streptococcus pyogenes]VGQ89286.1 prophage minor structural protein [Streptococcus pyogenes]
MTRLISQQILSEYVKSLEVEADKVVIPGQNTPVFSWDRDGNGNGNLSIDTPLLKVRGESLATQADLTTISLTPGPKGELWQTSVERLDIKVDKHISLTFKNGVRID